MRRPRRVHRTAAALTALAGFGAGAAAVGAEGGVMSPAGDPATPEAAAVTVALTRDVLVAQSTAWLDAMDESELTNLNFSSASSVAAREALLTGRLPAAIVGSPPTDAELEAAGRPELVAVPVHVSAAMFLLSEPFPNGFEERRQVSPEEDPTCDPLGDDYDASRCEERVPLEGAIRVPHQNLAAMLLRVAQDNLRTWRHPDVLAALEAPDLNLSDLDAPSVIHREPGDAINLHLQRYIVTAAPQVWELAKQENPGVDFQVDESIPRAITRSSPTFQAQQVGLWQIDPRTGSATSSGWGGNLAAVPPSAKLEVQEVYPLTPYRVIEVANASGAYLAPTAASISRAVEAGGDTPLDALTNAAAQDAYPLVWVDHLYLRTAGLSAATVNSLAATARYLATVGQEGAAALGEGRLSAQLEAKALAAVDTFVRASCVGDSVRVTMRDDPGPYAPPLLAAAGIGSIAQCDVVAPAAATPDTVAPTASPADDPAATDGIGPGADGPVAGQLVTASPSPVPARPLVASGAISAAPTALPPAAAVATYSEPQGTAAVTDGGAPTQAVLPFALPVVARAHLDSFATMLLGAGTFFTTRSVTRRRKSAG